jgi:hypothetical protein
MLRRLFFPSPVARSSITPTSNGALVTTGAGAGAVPVATAAVADEEQEKEELVEDAR